VNHNDKMPNIHQLLTEMDSDPRAHLIVAAMPSIIAAGIRAWEAFGELHLEDRVASTMNAMATEVQIQIPGNISS
jgi:hypothetical protein